MIIMHESMPEEAADTANAIKRVYGLDSRIVERNFDDVFVPIPKFNGYSDSWYQLFKAIPELETKSVMVLTQKDIYFGDRDQDIDWIFGYYSGKLTVVSNARMKGKSCQPVPTLQVPMALYLRRLAVLAIHEIGHGVIKRTDRLKEAVAVNTAKNLEQQLGPHCTDNRCGFYEIIDIRAPAPETGEFMLLGDEPKFDAGLDDLIERMYPEWFCKKCRADISITKEYK